MTNRLITPAAALAVSLEAAKANLRIDGSDMDALVEAWLRGIIAHAEHETGRSFIHQARRVTLDAFPDAIRLDYAPIASVSAMKFYDANGVLQTLDPADYRVDDVSEPGYVVPAPGKAWPATDGRINGVTVDYLAGYGADESAVPDGIKLYILAKLTEQFDPSVRPEKDTVQASFIDHLLDPFRIYTL